MHEVHFKEPAWIWLIFVGSFGLFWPVVWGIVPLAGGDEFPGFMRLLFPAIGLLGAVIGWGLAWRLRGAGFSFTAMGIEGAADSEKATVPWSQVRGIGFQLDPSMRVNGVPVKRMVAHLVDGSVLRVSTLGLADPSRWEDQLTQARTAGVLPGSVEVMSAPSLDAYGRAAAELRALADAGVDPQDVLDAAAEIRRRRLGTDTSQTTRDGWVEDRIDEPPPDGGTSWPSS